MHKERSEAAKTRGRVYPRTRPPSWGVLQRDPGEVRAFVVPDRKKPTVQAKIRENVHPPVSEVFHGRSPVLRGTHLRVRPRSRRPCRVATPGATSTPTAWSNPWSLLKRTLGGTYVAVAPFHLHRYVNEQVFRYNARKGTDGGRFLAVAGGRRSESGSPTRI